RWVTKASISSKLPSSSRRSRRSRADSLPRACCWRSRSSPPPRRARARNSRRRAILPAVVRASVPSAGRRFAARRPPAVGLPAGAAAPPSWAGATRRPCGCSSPIAKLRLRGEIERGQQLGRHVVWAALVRCDRLVRGFPARRSGRGREPGRQAALGGGEDARAGALQRAAGAGLAGRPVLALGLDGAHQSGPALAG